MENEGLDFSRLFLEKEFKHPWGTEWTIVSEQAAEWLYDIWKNNFSNRNIYCFAPSYVFENNRINMYKYRKGKLYDRLFPEDVKSVRKEDNTNEKQISFWEIVSLSKKNISLAVNRSRSADRYFIFFSNEDNINNFPFDIFLFKNHKHCYESINNRKTMNMLLDKGFVIVRNWGSHDDPKLWCQIFV